VRKVREEKNRLNGFSLARSWFTALKRGVNEMISTEQFDFQNSAAGRRGFLESRPGCKSPRRNSCNCQRDKLPPEKQGCKELFEKKRGACGIEIT
jgi:hypothetical protein